MLFVCVVFCYVFVLLLSLWVVVGCCLVLVVIWVVVFGVRCLLFVVSFGLCGVS